MKYYKKITIRLRIVYFTNIFLSKIRLSSSILLFNYKPIGNDVFTKKEEKYQNW
jgi:hypothetical protein